MSVLFLFAVYINMLAGYVLSFTYMFMSIVALLATRYQSSKRGGYGFVKKESNARHQKAHVRKIHVTIAEDKCVPKQYNKHKNKVHQLVTEFMSLCSFGPRGKATPTSAGSPRPPGNFVELTL